MQRSKRDTVSYTHLRTRSAWILDVEIIVRCGNDNVPVVRGIVADTILIVTTGHVMSMDELANVKGRGWEDIDVSAMISSLCRELKTDNSVSIDPPKQT